MTIYMPLPVMGVLSCKTLIDLMSKYITLRAFFSMRIVCPVLPTSFKGSKGLGLYTPPLVPMGFEGSVVRQISQKEPNHQPKPCACFPSDGQGKSFGSECYYRLFFGKPLEFLSA